MPNRPWPTSADPFIEDGVFNPRYHPPRPEPAPAPEPTTDDRRPTTDDRRPTTHGAGYSPSHPTTEGVTRLQMM